MRARLALVAAAVAVTSLTSLGASHSTAAWTDTVYRSVQATAGSWELPTEHSSFECYPVDPTLVANCEVFGITFFHSGNNYRAHWGIRSTTPVPFAWEVRLDLSQAYDGPYTGNPGLFPGQPVPSGPWWPEWTITGFSLTGSCIASTPAEMPVVRLRGLAWNRLISSSTAGGQGYASGLFGIQPSIGAAWPITTCP